MASVTLGTLKTYWQNVSQWVTGTSSSIPLVRTSAKIEKLGESLNFTVTAGSANDGALGRLDVTDYRAIIVGVRSANNHEYDITKTFFVANGGTHGTIVLYRELITTSFDTLPEHQGQMEVEGEEAQILITNKDTVDQAYDLHVMGVR